MKAASANKVKRVVITSSIDAIKGKIDRSQLHFKSTDWSDAAEIGNQDQKFRAEWEKIAWDYRNTEDKSVEIVSINPGFIIGPTISGG